MNRFPPVGRQGRKASHEILNLKSDISKILGTFRPKPSMVLPETLKGFSKTFGRCGRLARRWQSGARVMHAADATTLSLDALPRGIYVINVEAGTGRQVLKIAR